VNSYSDPPTRLRRPRATASVPTALRVCDRRLSCAKAPTWPACPPGRRRCKFAPRAFLLPSVGHLGVRRFLHLLQPLHCPLRSSQQHAHVPRCRPQPPYRPLQRNRLGVKSGLEHLYASGALRKHWIRNKKRKPFYYKDLRKPRNPLRHSQRRQYYHAHQTGGVGVKVGFSSPGTPAGDFSVGQESTDRTKEPGWP